MSTTTKEKKPIPKVSHAKAMTTEIKNWVGLPQLCPACDQVGIIGVNFGLRKMKPHLPPVPQSWCKECRRQERILRANYQGADSLSTDDVKELIRKYHGDTGYIKPVDDEKQAAKKQAAKKQAEAAKQAKKQERANKQASKVKSRGTNVITNSRRELAVIYDIHCPEGFHGKHGDDLQWKLMFRKLREKLGSEMILDKSVLDFPDYLEVLEADNNEF